MSTATATPVDTTTVEGRRQLRFESLDDILADVERLAKAREIRTLGNWTAGKTLNHLALPMIKSIDGFESRMSWIIRNVMGTFFKKKFLNSPMKPGFNLPKKAATELVVDCDWNEALEKFRSAVRRLKSETKRADSPFLGKMSLEDWDKLHCRHAELHLSFLVPVG